MTKPQYFAPDNFQYLCVISPDKITIHKKKDVSWENFDYLYLENNPNLLGGYYETKPYITINKFNRVFITSYNSQYEDKSEKFGNTNKYCPTVSITYKGKEFIYHKRNNFFVYILIHTHGNEYISLGVVICRFTTNNDRILFASPGNHSKSGSMAPYAIGNKYGYVLDDYDNTEEWKYIDLKNLKIKDPHNYYDSGYITKEKKKFLFFKFNIRHYERAPEGTFKDFKVENLEVK